MKKTVIVIFAAMAIALPTFAKDQISEIFQTWIARSDLEQVVLQINKTKRVVVLCNGENYTAQGDEAEQIKLVLMTLIEKKTDEIKRNKELIK